MRVIREVRIPCWLMRRPIATASTSSATTTIATKTKVFLSESKYRKSLNKWK